MHAAVGRANAVGRGIGLVPFNENEGVSWAAAHRDPSDLKPNVGQESVETLVPAPGRGERPSRPPKGGVTEKAMLELGRKAPENGLRISITDGVEKAANVSADEGVIHAAAQSSIIEPYTLEFNDATD
jgi:hypothetical protein